MSLFNMLIEHLRRSTIPLTLSEQVLMQVSDNLDDCNVLTRSKEEIAQSLECSDHRLRTLVVEQTFSFLMNQGLLVRENDRYRVAA